MIDISVVPDEDPVLILGFIVDEFTDVDITHDVLHAIAIFTIILELAFIETKGVIGVDQETETVVEIVAGMTEIDVIGRFKDEELIVLFELLLCQLL